MAYWSSSHVLYCVSEAQPLHVFRKQQFLASVRIFDMRTRHVLEMTTALLSGFVLLLFVCLLANIYVTAPRISSYTSVQV